MNRSPSQEEALFAKLIAQPPGERPAYLDQVCAGNPELRERLGALLAAHGCVRSFLEPSVALFAAGVRDEETGDTIGRYKLRQKLGEGGCGIVYMAEQEEPVRRRVALKVIKAGMDTREVIARFEAERQALALMQHPNIAQVFDAGTTAAGRPYFVMELVRGVAITKFCDDHALSTEARLDLFIRICDAVQHAHHKGVIHRDLKPSNILVMLRGETPVPKVIDFGIAKGMQGRLANSTIVTVIEQFLGTPAYMSPEQAEMSALDIDTRSDVYSLGVLLYELLVGHTPFDAKTLSQASRDEIRRIIREVEPPRPSLRLAAIDEKERAAVAKRRGTEPERLATIVSGDLDWIVMKALEKNRGRRYETPAAIAADITRHLQHEPVVARPPSNLYRAGKFIRRNRLPFAAAAALTLTLVAGTMVSTWQAVRARRAENRANVERARAEELLGFMIGDLRTELAKVGRLDVLEAVGDKSMNYFASLDPGELNDATLGRHAKALTQIGGIRMEQARYAEAMESFRAAYARAAEAAARRPANGELLFERGQAEYWIGFVYQKRGDLPAASEWLVRYRDTCVTLASLDPSRAAWQRELAYGQHNLAVMRKERGEFAAAREGFLAALATWQRLHAANPTELELRFQISDTHSWLGGLAEECGEYAEAATRVAERVRHLEEISRIDPVNPRWRHKLADGLLFEADILILTGRLAAARERLEKSRALMDDLVRHDPANRRWLSTSLNIRLRQVRVARQAGEPTMAALTVQEIRSQLEKLVAAEPTDRGFAMLLASAWRVEAQLRLAAGRADARVAAAQAIDVGERLIREGRETAGAVGECAQAWLVAGEISERNGEPEAAQKQWSRAAEVLGNPRDTRDWRLLDPALRVAALARRIDDAATLTARLHQLGYFPLDPWPDADRRSVVNK